jgi:UDP-N-acetyl-alpha-D-muramoyl-L-alanyl-L-glutamate epimerase
MKQEGHTTTQRKKNNMHTFKILDYEYKTEGRKLVVDFKYKFDHVGEVFVENVIFPITQEWSDVIEYDLRRALDHYALVASVSYLKFFPYSEIQISEHVYISSDQVDYLNTTFKNGLGEFWFTNKLDPNKFVGFKDKGYSQLVKNECMEIVSTKLLVLQSGGKDSLVTAQLVREKGLEFDSLYVTNKSAGYPEFLNESCKPGKLLIGSRTVDLSQNELMLANGGHLGHVPFSAIYSAYSMVVAVMGEYTHVLASLESSSKEGNEMIGDLVVNHQWSKSLTHEKMFNELIAKLYLNEHSYGSIIRPFTELKIAELFVEKCFDQFGYKFSSCNQANYIQGHDPSSLGWCLNCAKCANAALLFAPFLEREKLEKLFSGNPFKNTNLTKHFIDLLGQGAHKPFECVAETDELKMAYNMSLQREPDYAIEGLSPVEVPVYDYLEEHEHSGIVEDLGFKAGICLLESLERFIGSNPIDDAAVAVINEERKMQRLKAKEYQDKDDKLFHDF